MIYIKNNTEIQTIYINRNDEMPCGHHAGSSDYIDGYDDGFGDGYESGVTDQKNKLVATAFTYNSAFTRADGWSAVTVNVPQSGHTSEELQEWYDSGYTSGITDGYDSGFTDGYESGFTDGYNSGWTDGYNSGYTSGITDGYNSGYTSGTTDGYASGWTDGYQSGFTDGYNSGYTSGITDGYNSGYTSGVTDGYSSGLTDGYESGYTEGVEDGKDIQKRLLTSSAFTYNGEYQRENGWSAITINVNQSGHTDQELFDMYESGYTSGFTDGVISQKELLASTAFTENGHYERENGWNEVDVNIDTASTYQSGYTDGYESGTTHQQELLSSSAFTTNGSYVNPSGWSAITINVNQSGHTDQELADMWQSGYTSGLTDGFAEGYGSGYTDGYASGYSFGFASGRTYQRSLLGTTAFTENGTYTSVNGWSSVTVNQDTVGELYAIYLENGEIELNGYNEPYNGMYMLGLPKSDMGITVKGKTSDYPSVTHDVRNFIWSGNASTYIFYSGAYPQVPSAHTDSWIWSTTSSTQTTKTFPDYHAINLLNNEQSKVDNYTVSGGAGVARPCTASTVSISASSLYIKVVDVGGDCGEYFPYVDSNGNACLRGYFGNLHYPTSGNAYPVYRKLINGTYRYYIMNYVA